MTTTSNNPDSDEPGLDITQQPTGEFPLPDFKVVSNDLPPGLANLGGHERGPDQQENQPGKTEFENEVVRLRAKWLSIETEFTNRETRIAELQQQILAREQVSEWLGASLAREVNAVKEAQQQLARKDAEIATLLAAGGTGGERSNPTAAQFAGSEAARARSEEESARARAEIARLQQALAHDQAASAKAAKRNEELLAEQARLRSKLQDLESYVDGRQASWSDLNKELANRKESVVEVATAVAEREATIARHNAEKNELGARIRDLERQCSEFSGRRKEIESAHEELKREHASGTKELERAAAEALSSRRRIESLERDIERRAETIAALNAQLAAQRNAAGEPTANGMGASRVDEKKLGDLEQQAAALRDDVRLGHERLAVAQQQLAARTRELAANDDALKATAEQVEQLTKALRSAQEEAAELLPEPRHEAGRRRRDTANRLEESVERIADLVAALDKQRAGGGAARGAKAEANSDFVATVAADDHAGAARRKGLGSTESPPIDALYTGEALDGNGLTGARGQLKPESTRKLVALIDGKLLTFPLIKSHITIGRGRNADIYIDAKFISRVHARLRTSGSGTTIEDAGSKNGVLVNSEPITRHLLRDGDIVSLGGELFMRFVESAS